MTKKQFIKLEPHSEYKKAISRRDRNGCITYNYDLLVNVTARVYDMPYDEAVEWTDYNICGLTCNGFKISYARPRKRVK